MKTPPRSPGPRASLGLAAWVLVFAAAGTGAGADLSRVYQRCRETCPEVLISGRHAGTAWVAGRDGSVITAAHLFDCRRPRVELLFTDNRRVRARLVALDRGHDVALLTVGSGEPDPKIKLLQLAARTLAVGDAVYQFGAPVFRTATLQPGHIASDRTQFEFQPDVTDYVEVVPVSAMMQGGTSGGPWLNRRGEVVGVQSSTVSLDGKPVGVAFLAPAPVIQRLLDRRVNATTPTPGLGVDELWQQSAEYLERLPPGTSGLVASVVRDSGPAARAGIAPRDVLLAVDGQPLVRIADLPRVVRRHQPGDTVEFTVLRPGTTDPRRLPVVLACAEEIWEADDGAASGQTSEP